MMRRVLAIMAFIVLATLLSVDIYLRLQPSRSAAPAPTPQPSPSPVPTATPVPEATLETPTPAAVVENVPPADTPTSPPSVTVEETRVEPAPTAAPARTRAPRVARPAPRPRRTPRATASAAALVAEAERAVAARDYTRAATLYDQALALEPGNAKATAGRNQVAAELASRRSFVAGETIFTTGETLVESTSATTPEVPAGFEPGGVTAKPAPKIPASIEFELIPKKVKPGDPYTVKIYLRNTGKKSIRIRELRLASTLNGSRSEAALTPKIKDVPGGMLALLAEIPSVWRPNVRTWSMEVAVRSGHGDIYKNSVGWR